MREKFTPVVTASLSLAFATGLYGVSFGALSVASGLSVWQSMALSLIMFSGGSQFAFIGVVATGGTGGAATAAATLLYVRNGIYGAQINHWLRPRGWRKPLAAQLTIDESAGMSSLHSEQQDKQTAFWVTGIGVFVFWNAFTFVGTQLGARLDPQAWGLDGAAVAAFVALLWPRVKNREAAAVAVLGAVVTLVLIPVVPAGMPIIAAAALSAIAGWKITSHNLATSPQRAAHTDEEPS